MSVMGAVVGSTLGTVTVLAQAGEWPDPAMSVALATLVVIAAMVGSVPAIISAAFREPLYVLRSG
jgi:hypothetical protein